MCAGLTARAPGDLCKSVVSELDTVLERKTEYREFVQHRDHVFPPN
jgi:hypothetical protein